MKTHLAMTLSIAMLGASACAATEAQPPDTRSPALRAHDGARAPLLVRLRGPAAVQPGSEIEVSFALVRSAPNAVPIEVSVDLPEGVSLLDGQVRETIVDRSSTEIARTLRLRVDTIPAGDLRVIADARGANYGVHATDGYRFGRPASLLPTPSRGPAIVLRGGRRLGAPVRLR